MEAGTTNARSRGWPREFPVLQPPNAPLVMAEVALLATVVTRGRARVWARGAFHAAFAAWAGGELVSGVNWVRRLMGVVGLGYVASRIAARRRS
jgi:hypothetical protein